MLHKHKLAVALGLLALLGAVEVAEARMKFFSGTRSQVKSACTGAGRTYNEGTDFFGTGWSMCWDAGSDIGVICGDEGSCIGTGDGLTRYAGRVGTKPQPKPKPRGNFVPPESLSEQSSGSGTIDPTAPQIEPEIIIIN